MSSPALLHLLARRAKRKCGAAGSEPVNASGSEAAAAAPDTGPALSLRADTELAGPSRVTQPSAVDAAVVALRSRRERGGRGGVQIYPPAYLCRIAAGGSAPEA
jgi:hypothetical protein